VTDDELWRAFVEARRAVHAAQWEFHQGGKDRLEVLRRALQSRYTADLDAALDYLTVFPDHRVALLPELVELSTSEKTALEARRAIGYGINAELTQHVVRLLPAADEWDLRRYAELAEHAGARELLAKIVEHAATVDDLDHREIVEDYG
jgi:hypothetical protein